MTHPNSEFVASIPVKHMLKSHAPITATILLYLAASTPIPVQAAAPRAVLVELFTSEGCSSCPPADALLRQISETRPVPGQLIVALSEHVTYWNSLGWSDPFSSSLYTDRQNAYGRHFNLDSVYTPQMVINGTHQFVGSDRSALLQAVRAEQNQAASISLQITSATAAGALLTVKFGVSGDVLSAANAEVYAVLADDMDQSSVLRGENSGRTLSHVAVARYLMRMSPLKTGTDQTVDVPIPSSLHGPQRRHVILFAQAAGNGRVFAVDQMALASPLP